MSIMLLLSQRFIQWVYQIVIYFNPYDLYVSMLNALLNYVISSKYVFRPLVRLWFLYLSNGSIVVTIALSWLKNTRNHSMFCNELLDLNNFFYRFREGNALKLYCKISNCILLWEFLANYTTIQINDKSWLEFEVISINLKTSIITSSYSKLSLSFINQKSILSPSQVLEDIFNSFLVSFTWFRFISIINTQGI